MSDTVDSDRPDPGPQADPLLHLAASRALGRLAIHAGVRHDAATLRRRLFACEAPEETEETAAAQRLDWMATACRELGMRTNIATASARDMVAILERGQPLVTSSDCGRRWYFLLPPKGGKIEITKYEEDREETQRLRPSELHVFLEREKGANTSWLIAQDATPQDEAVSEGDGRQLTPRQRLWKLLAPERADVYAVVAFSVTIGVLSLATPIAVQAIVNSIALGGLIQPLIVVALLLALALSFSAALTAIQTWVVELIQRRLFVRTVADVAARLPRVTAQAYDEGHGPELVNRFFDIVTVQKALAKLLIDALSIVLSVLVGLAVLAFYHPLLLAFDAFLLIVIALIVFGPLRRGTSTALRESSAKYAVVAWLEEVARCPQTFKAAGAEQWIFERSDQLSRGWLGTRSKHFRVIFGQMISALVLLVVASTVLLGIGGLLVIDGSLTLGQLVAAELIVTSIVASVAKMGKHLEQWYDMMAGVYKVGQLLDVPVEPIAGEHPPRRGDARGASLELDGVGMKDGRGRPLFEGCDVMVSGGERLAVTGPSGSGKTALLQMIWRMREPASGAIRVDDRDYRDLAIDAIHEDIALVSAVEIVRGTVRENIRLHRPFVSADDVRRAVRATGLEDAVADFDEGLGSPIHPNTPQLSKGEKDRLMLARALAGRPRVLLIDGIFDRMRPESRDALLEATFGEACEGATIIVATESDEVIARCDKILELGKPSRVVPVPAAAASSNGDS